MRLDRYLVEHGYSVSREKAKNEILSGWVSVGGERCHDPAKNIPDDSVIDISRPGGLYVSRGGYKLEKALDSFSLDVNGIAAADLGASTGGFTDCLLKRGAAFVYALDVGYGQLDYALRNDPRVCVYERTNARSMKPDMFTHDISLVVSDLSFISFSKVFPVIRSIFTNAEGIALVKPQFESLPAEHKKGVVRGTAQHIQIVSRLFDALFEQGICMKAFDFSPVKGPKGNIEFLLHYDTFSTPSRLHNSKIELTVHAAHDQLDS